MPSSSIASIRTEQGLPRALERRSGATRPVWLSYAVLVAPLVAFLVVLYVWPMCRILLLSIDWPRITTDSYTRIATVPAYGAVILNSLKIAGLVTIASLALGYPLAYYITSRPPRVARLLLMAVLIPFGTSLLVRNYAWMVLLGNNGLINNLLLWLGLIQSPLSLLYNTTGAVVGMVHILLPYMILVLVSVMRGIDWRLVDAALGLGAGQGRVFRTVYLPLSMPGVAAGCLLVFIMSLGFFVTPALLGGRSGTMISMVIETQINQLVNWPLGAALAVSLLVVTLVLLGFYNQILGVKKIARDLV
jgi:ABC-type spermidine/putrescine transport system permease subunit I